MTPDAEPQPQSESSSEQTPPSEPTSSTVAAEGTVRRVPRYPRFLILGAGLGAVATFIATASFPVDPNVGFGALFGYFLLFGVPAGAVVGALVALILDRVLKARGRTVMAERTIVDPLPDEPAP
jgi:hypothetical protein